MFVECKIGEALNRDSNEMLGYIFRLTVLDDDKLKVLYEPYHSEIFKSENEAKEKAMEALLLIKSRLGNCECPKCKSEIIEETIH